MPDNTAKDIEERLTELLGGSIPQHAAADISAAMEIAENLQQQGAQFKLRDMNPRSIVDTLWQAVFTQNDTEYSAEHSQSAMAICLAAIGYLSQKQ